MTNTVSNGMAAPPGLNAPCEEAASATAAEVLGSGASSTKQAARNDITLCKSTEQQAIIDEVRRSVLEDVEAKVAEKMKDLWARGNKMIKKVDEDSRQKNATIAALLEECRQKQEALKLENENLKDVFASMAQQLHMVGVGLSSLAGTKIASPTPCSLAVLSAALSTNGTTTPTDTQAISSSASAATTLQDSPQTDFSASGYGSGSFPPLPTVPDFPFAQTTAAPTPTPSPATPLSLAEALNSETASPSVAVSLMGSLPPPSQGQRIFSFTLRKADGTDLGLNVSHNGDDKALRVEGVRPEGAVEAWNRQCFGSTPSDKAVLPGDRIVSVNGVVNDPVKMLEECRDKQLLKITVTRGEAAAAPKPLVLRADAQEFVPTGIAPSGGLDSISEKPEALAEDATVRRVWTNSEDKAETPSEATESS